MKSTCSYLAMLCYWSAALALIIAMMIGNYHLGAVVAGLLALSRLFEGKAKEGEPGE